MFFWSFIFFAGLSITFATNSRAFVKERSCGSLYNANTAFHLNDFDQSVNMQKDYRVSTSGWWNTTSIFVEKNCWMNLCTGAYFLGRCHTLTTGNHSDINLISNTRSSNCSCERICKCEDVHIPKCQYSCGRAYTLNSCNKCDSEYFPLVFKDAYSKNIIPPEYADSIEKIVLRRGCSLTVWPEDNEQGASKIVQGSSFLTGRIRSYKCTCDDDAYVPQERPDYYPPLTTLPSKKSTLLSLMPSNLTAATHPGLQAALKSLKNGRSFQNAYILLLGIFNPIWIGLWGCTDAIEEIGECHISVDLDSIGISNAQVRVIYGNIAQSWHDKGNEEDYRWAATLADYLSNHVELKNAIPNAVVVWQDHNPNIDVTLEGSRFQRTLSVVNALRSLILDEHYSNLIFLGDGLPKFALEERNPEEQLRKFEKAIVDKWALPEPLFMVPRTWWAGAAWWPPTVNGYYRMQNGEFMYRNLQEILKLTADNSGDALGFAIFNAAFPREKQISVRMHNKVNLLPANHREVLLFKNFTKNPLPLYLQKRVNANQLRVLKSLEKCEDMENRIQQIIANEMEKVKQEIVNKIKIDLDKLFE